MPIAASTLGATTTVDQQVDTRWVLAYAASLGLTDPVYLDDAQAGGPLVVPMFAVCLEWAVTISARGAMSSLAPEERRMGVHAYQSSRFIAPIHAGMNVSTTSRVIHMRRTSAGAYLLASYDTVERETGDLLVSSLAGTMFRGVAIDVEQAGQAPVAGPKRVNAAEPIRSIVIPIDAGLPHVYSECARIWNPIHTEERVAHAAGLEGIILHGTATWALAGIEVVRACADGDLRQLRELSGSFRKPVQPRESITTRVQWRVGEEIGFDVLNGVGEMAVSGGRVSLGSGD